MSDKMQNSSFSISTRHDHRVPKSETANSLRKFSHPPLLFPFLTYTFQSPPQTVEDLAPLCFSTITLEVWGKSWSFMRRGRPAGGVLINWNLGEHEKLKKCLQNQKDSDVQQHDVYSPTGTDHITLEGHSGFKVILVVTWSSEELSH